jgi:protoporphyrinogen oxidase
VIDKIPSNLAHVLLLKLAAKCTHRAIAIGYGKEKPASVHVWHVYPEGGLSSLCQHLASELADAIRLESPVEEILVESEEVVAVRAQGRYQKVSAVISTAPVNRLPELVTGTHALDYLSKFRYRPMLFVNMRFRGRGLLPDVVLWTPERHWPFFRLTEATLSMPWLAPEGKTLITLDIGCSVGDRFWTMEDADLGAFCLDAMESIVRGARHSYLGCRVLRTAIAYPVFLTEYENERRRFQRTTGVRGLYSVGRNGEFDHLLTEDVYWRTLRKTPEILEFLTYQTSARAAQAFA